LGDLRLLFIDNAMSLLGQASSSRNVLPDDDDFDQPFDDQPFDSAQQDGLNDGFDDDADDDDMSLDGIYDDDDEDDEDTPPPTYEEPPSTSAFSKVSDTKGGPAGSAFDAQTPKRSLFDFTFRRPLAPPNSALPNSPFVIPNSAPPQSPLGPPSPSLALPHSPLVVRSSAPRGAPVTPPRTYYPGVDICIVRALPSMFHVEY